MRKIKYFLMIIMLISILSGCGNGGSKFEVSSQDKNAKELTTTVYSDSELSDIVSFAGSAEELNKEYPIECVRKTDAGYRITYRGETDWAIITLDGSWEILNGNVCKMSRSKTYFDVFSAGVSVEDVQAIDPDGDYSAATQKSVHYTSDGYLITIEYDDSIIVNMETEMI